MEQSTTTASTSLDPEISKDPRIKYDKDLNEYVMETEEEGMSLVWDKEKRAWFPMFREELVSQQQSIYETKTLTKAEAAEERKKKRKQAVKPLLKVSESSIYVQNLPTDITTDELSEYFSKCGIILPDVDTGLPKIKIYKDPETGEAKGDGLITYFKPESVDLAITLLHETEIRPGYMITVEKAKFENKNSETHSEPAVKKQTFGPKVKKEQRKKLEAHVKRLEKHLDWTDEAEIDKRAKKAARTVILKHMFKKGEFINDPSLILDLKEEIQEECEKLGIVTSITVYDTNPDGVVAVRFQEEISAQACIQLMDGRFFDGQKVEASIYDGQTKFGLSDRQETEEDEKARLKRHEEWLESGGDYDDNKKQKI